MPSLAAVRKAIRVKEVGKGDLRLDFEVRVSPSGLVQVNGQPVGDHKSGSNELGWVSVFEHFSMHMIELRKQQERKQREIAAAS
jgi:hypothetical protein